MTREDMLREILSLNCSNLLLELATGTGKSRLALEWIKSFGDSKDKTLLLVVNRNVHKQNWMEEIHKWWPDCQLTIVMTTYISLPKWAGMYNYAIFDECHHLSERCRGVLYHFSIAHSVLCSATVKKELKRDLDYMFFRTGGLVTYTKDLRDVIEDDILPDPKVYLLPLSLRADLPTEVIWKNPKAKGRLIECSWATKWNFVKQRTNPVRIYCTEEQYLVDLDNQIHYWKNRFKSTFSPIDKRKWLRLCMDRLKWLSDKKVGLVRDLLCHLGKYRTLTFCNSIEQTELLGKHCINSKNKASVAVLEAFNAGKINHITACNMLNEGMNLADCQVGIYANLNSSETIIKQRMGRILRHPNPVLIVPYYKGTREEEIVKTMLENYNPELVQEITTINEIRV